MDLRALSDNLDLELNDFMDLVELFLAASRADIETFKNACETGDAAAAAEAAHSLKGSSGNLGFMDFSNEALRAEKQAKEEDLDGLIVYAVVFEEHLSAIEDVLRSQASTSET